MTLDYFYGQAGELFSFFRIPKALFQEQRFQDLSTDAKTLYGILLDRMSLSVKNEWFDKKGRVFIIFTIEDVKRTLRCADNKATRLLRELEKFGLIERKRRGQGKPCLVYVKNFSAESSKKSVKNRDNDDSCGSKIACQDPVKSRGIKKKENKTEMNNTNPILSDESEKMKDRELLEEYFSCSLEIDLLLRLYRKSGYSKKFLEAHREEITLHKAAKAAFDEAGLQKLPKVKELDAEFAELLTKKKAAYPDYRKARNEMQELVRAQKNVERFFAEEKDTTEKTQTR